MPIRIERSALRVLLLIALAAPGCGRGDGVHPTTDEIVWDRWGVPHIYATDHASLFRGYGWAQAHAHGDLLLRLIGTARGRSAEYWGADGLDLDGWLWTYGVPQRGRRDHAAADPEMRRLVDAFAAGINAYAEAHPDRIAEESAVVLPVDGGDIYGLSAAAAALFSPALPISRQWQARGSNAWAIAPSKSATGNALLLANPHLPWSDNFTWFEAHLIAPGIDLYGASLIGMPVINIGFNERLGWTHTVNTVDTEDHYELTLEGGGYSWDGVVRAFDADTVVLHVREADGALRDDTVVIRSSVHGPVIAMRDGRALAVRSADMMTAGRLFDQYWAMGRAGNLDEFREALRLHQVPGFTVTYADRDGNILHEYGGVAPVRPHGDYAYWSGIVPGDTSATLWTELHPYEDMPRVLNPPSGWVQNANEPPWWATFPPAVDPGDHPPYFGPLPMHFRAQRSIRMLDEADRISFEEMIAMKYSTRLELADRILPELVAAARTRGGAAAEAATTLEEWDRSTDGDSRGAVLFEAWLGAAGRTHAPAGIFARPWSGDEPRTTPSGLRDPELAAAALETAAETVRARHGAIDVAWGDIYRLRRDTVDLPGLGAGGGLGSFTAVGYGQMRDGRAPAVAGESFIAAVEFGNPVRARTLIVYGNASQPGSPHRTDQIGLFAAKRLRPVWLTRSEVEDNALERMAF